MSLIDKIKKIVQKYEEIQVPTYTLSDGTVVSIDKLEVGGKVLLTDGTVPTAGEYTLDDGTVITTDEAGLILTLVAPTAMETATLLDGTVISVSTLDVGGSVLIDGAPAKEGTYTLSDNTVLTVDVEGKIVTVTPTAQDAATDFSKITKEQFDTLTSKFEGGVPDLAAMWVMVKGLFEYNFAWKLNNPEQTAKDDATQAEVDKAVDDALTTYKSGFAKIEKENTELKGTFKDLLEIVQELAKEPAVEPPTKKTRMSLQDSNRKLNQLERMAQAAERVKK